MSKTLKILLSCMIGSGIGTFIALSVNSWFWWTGALAGGLIGYLSYEFKKVIQAIPKAWRAVSGWKPDKYYWKAYFVLAGFLFQSFFSGLISVSYLLHICSSADSVTFYNVFLVELFVCLSISLTTSFLGAERVLVKSEAVKADVIRYYKDLYRSYNIFVALYRLIRGLIEFIMFLPEAIWVLFKACGRFGLLMGKFFKKLFVLIHSEIRLLCAIDSLFGVVAGYLISRAYSLDLLAGVIVGMIAGVLLGIANYQIFSVRILKVAPKKSE